jgi:hypothetical protein
VRDAAAAPLDPYCTPREIGTGPAC